jgi:hypothetical protein
MQGQSSFFVPRAGAELSGRPTHQHLDDFWVRSTLSSGSVIPSSTKRCSIESTNLAGGRCFIRSCKQFSPITVPSTAEYPSSRQGPKSNVRSLRCSQMVVNSFRFKSLEREGIFGGFFFFLFVVVVWRPSLLWLLPLRRRRPKEKSGLVSFPIGIDCA